MSKNYYIPLFAICIIFLLYNIVYLRLDYYVVSTESMLPTIKPGNHIVIKLIRNKSHEFIDNTSLKNEILVLKKPQFSLIEEISMQGETNIYVKRCYAIPGDTVKIYKHDIRNKVPKLKGKYNNNIFPHNSEFSWSINDFGPLWVPQKGRKIHLTDENMVLYGSIIYSEGNKIGVENEKYLLNGVYSEFYTFKKDYYFFLGDNFYSSEDSRFWGFVPEENLIGKVIMII